MRNSITLLILLLSLTSFAQEGRPIQATTGVQVHELMFDSNNDSYMVGSVCGRVWIDGRYYDGYADGYQNIVGKLNDELTHDWLIPLDERPFASAMINGNIYVMTRLDEEKGADEKYRSMVIDVYGTDGSWKVNQELHGVTSSKYDVSLDGIVTDQGFLIWTNWKDDDSYVKTNGNKWSKDLYSMTRFSMYGLDGALKWEYDVEAGEGGFTDFRVQACEIGPDGKTIIVGSYGFKADVGIGEFTTDEMYPEYPSQPLHYGEVLIIEVSQDGNPLRAEVLGENELFVEDLLFDDEGNLYVSGYHKGNDIYAESQEDGRPYIGATIRGERFEYTAAMSTDAPTEDAFVCKLDADWNVVWCTNWTGPGSNRATYMVMSNAGISVAGTYSDDMTIDGRTHEDHADNIGYSDGFSCDISPDGMVSNIHLYTGEKSNLPRIYLNNNGKAIVDVGTKTNMYIDGVLHEGYGYWGGRFLFNTH